MVFKMPRIPTDPRGATSTSEADGGPQTPMSPADRQATWALAATSAQRYAREATEIATALESARCAPDGRTIVPPGTAARVRKARAFASLLVELTAEGS